ncbi:hypothetical protein [Fictibacillus sp. FJAT-27399]|uniref:hypothetical protein n=1 Tax=Fictibacillus sp. FJAT-27399 TaxID=1729689 RepID=UPI0012E35057|nr:hypothetical protein [Fictibacillus sp. FJAT-27399]
MISVSGCSLSAGRAVSLLGAWRLWVSPVPHLPQESRPLHSNQLGNEGFLQKTSQSNNLLEKSL